MTLLDTGPAQLAAAPALQRRFLSIDALRGLAVVGMLFVNNTGDRDATPEELAHSYWHGLTIAD